jgi:predicted RNA polymerase sigma factor
MARLAHQAQQLPQLGTLGSVQWRSISDGGTHVRRLEHAAMRHRRGPYRLEAASVACHAEALSWAEADREQIVVLYDMLLCLEPSPVTRLQRCIAVRYTAGAEATLTRLDEPTELDDPTELDGLEEALGLYHPYRATRAEPPRAVGQPFETRLADERAVALTNNPAEQRLPRQRVDWDRPDEVREYVLVA